MFVYQAYAVETIFITSEQPGPVRQGQSVESTAKFSLNQGIKTSHLSQFRKNPSVSGGRVFRDHPAVTCAWKVDR